MIHRAVDDNNDWLFGKGSQDYTKDLDAVKLNVKTRLQSWRGDSFRSTEEGVDYYNYLDKGTGNFLDSDVKRVILQSEGIIKIISYESDVDEDRKFTASVKVLTIYGITTIGV